MQTLKNYKTHNNILTAAPSSDSCASETAVPDSSTPVLLTTVRHNYIKTHFSD